MSHTEQHEISLNILEKHSGNVVLGESCTPDHKTAENNSLDEFRFYVSTQKEDIIANSLYCKLWDSK